MQIIRGKIHCAKKVLIYGPEGIGKSTFASHFPDPVFIDTEGSTKDIDVARFEKASSWTMLMEQVRYTKMNPSVCRTLVIDTTDWAEQMCVADLCARYGKKGVEDFGYGNGYVYAKEEFGRFLNSLEEVVEAGVNVILTAHAQMRKFEQPDEMGSYDRWELKLGKKTSSQTAPLVKEWADMVLFANYKTWSVAVDDKGKKRKAQGGARVMYTSHHPCWDAKNRYGLPEEVPFEYESIRSIIEGGSQAATSQPMDPVQQEAPVISTPTAPPIQSATSQPVPPVQETTPVQQTMDLTPPAVAPAAGEKFTGNTSDFDPDARIPKALRDLMINNNVCEWDLQRVVEARGYFPGDMPVYEYPKDFIEGVLVGAWNQVFAMIKEMKEKEAIPFN